MPDATATTGTTNTAAGVNEATGTNTKPLHPQISLEPTPPPLMR